MGFFLRKDWFRYHYPHQIYYSVFQIVFTGSVSPTLAFYSQFSYMLTFFNIIGQSNGFQFGYHYMELTLY